MLDSDWVASGLLMACRWGAFYTLLGQSQLGRAESLAQRETVTYLLSWWRSREQEGVGLTSKPMKKNQSVEAEVLRLDSFLFLEKRG